MWWGQGQTPVGGRVEWRAERGEGSGSLAHLVLPADNVGREFVPVLAVVTTDVALEGVSETMATHVDSEHDMVQEEDAAVLTLEGLHGLSALAHHPKHFLGGAWGAPQ